ncbi:DUF2231 domain-containing protein [Erythrobacter sp. YT30]|uniref:DUF2231 domain-containing protein n=1 Tax=Erythrobacter sp. YT30 TaxID=1735012 RepID=UPI00076BCA98|nr:DUF2231 domain-containing protein [Erythrobacter sp. YT30]KWV91896.1 hypothetical protein AUC45_12045 [Erythrobacter sp. YT30]
MRHWLALVTGALVFVVLASFPLPAAAHGDEVHGKPASEAVQVEEAGPVDPTNGEQGIVQTNEEVFAQTALGALKALHPATVHFPIALLIAAAMTEAFSARRPAADLRKTVDIMLYFAAAGAVVAALFGWLHTGLWMGGDVPMKVHRWLGTGLAALAVFLAVAAARSRDNGRATVRAGLVLLGIAVIVQGFLGGELAHGTGHLLAAG